MLGRSFEDLFEETFFSTPAPKSRVNGPSLSAGRSFWALHDSKKQNGPPAGDPFQTKESMLQLES